MTKKLLFAATAALAISSCTQVEVDEVAATQKEPIRFEQFINKATRADDVTTATLTEFYVLGKKYTSDGQSEDINITVTKSGSGWTCDPVVYWEEGAKYCFAATNYSTGVTFSGTETDYQLQSGEIDGYSARNNDMVVAICPNAIEGKATGNSPISLNFKHALAKVQVTFVWDREASSSSEVYMPKIESIERNSAFTLSNKSSQATWQGTGNNDDSMFSSSIEFNQKSESKTETLLVFPQDDTNFTPKLTFQIHDENVIGLSESIECDLFTGGVTEWEAGKVYKYKITIGTFARETLEFNATVSGWTDNTETDLGSGNYHSESIF